MNDHRHGGIAGPLILIAIGAAFLLSNMGVVSWSSWGLLRLWPLILVAIGIDLLIGRQSLWGTVVAGILIAAVLGGGLWMASTGYQPSIGSTSASVREPLQDASQAQIILKPAVGSLDLSALGPTAEDLITGNVHGQRASDVRSQSDLAGGALTFSMETTGTAVFVPTLGIDPTWDLRLNPTVPVDLNVEQGVGEMSLDLTLLKVTELRVTLGVGKITVRLPGSGKYTARIDGAIGDTTVILPPGLESRITMDAALAARSVPAGMTRHGNQYVSGGFANASDSVDLIIGQAIGNVSVERSAP